MKPILHLLGDRYKAQQYIWFAERKLKEMKNVMGLINTEFGNKMYALPNGSVSVYIESYLGVDKIRIVAAKKLSLRFSGDITLPLLVVDSIGAFYCDSFSADVRSGSAPLTVTFTDSSSGSPNGWLWDFGDGYQSTDQNPVHIYTVPGTYSVTLKSWVQSSTFNRNGFTDSTEARNGGPTGSQAAAYTAWQAASWSPQTGAQPRWKAQGNPPGQWQYNAHKGKTSSFDLSADTGRVDLLELSYANYKSYADATILLGTGVLLKPGTSSAWVFAQDVSAWVGDTLPEITIEDNSYSELPAVSSGETSGWDVTDCRVKVIVPASAPDECTNDDYITVT